MTDYKNPATIALHTGWRKDETTNSVTVPIHMTSSYQFDDADHAANLFALGELGNIYTRIMNPTNADFDIPLLELPLFRHRHIMTFTQLKI